MNDSELSDAIEHGKKIPVAYFDGLPVKFKNEDVTPAEALVALKNFMQLTAKNRLEDSRHVFAYYKFMVEMCGNDLLGKRDGMLKEPDQVWEYVTPLQFYFAKSDNKVHVVLEANVVWYDHGMVMSWENGERLVMVNEFDGATTNENSDYVFFVFKEEFCTKRI